MVGPQLEMECDDLSRLPPIPTSPGYTLRTFQPGDEAGWCACFAQWTAGPEQSYTEAGWTSEKLQAWFAMEGGTGIAAHENLFLVECDADGSIAATACCWSTPSHAESMGELGWVASVDEHRGKGLGNLVTIAVLHRLAALGKKTARLNTDDWRVPAIKAYLKMGFRASHVHESHPTRWKALEDLIASGEMAPNVAAAQPKL